MVDNNEQWNDIEFSQEDDADNEEYSSEEEEYEENSEDDNEYGDLEDYEVDDFKPKNTGNIRLVLILILVIMVGAFGFLGYSQYQKMTKANNENVATQQEQQYDEQEEEQKNDNNTSTDEVAENFFKEAGGESDENLMSVNFNNEGETNIGSNTQGDSSVATVTDVMDNQSGSDLFGTNNNQTQNNNGNQIMVSYNGDTRVNPFKPFELLLEKKAQDEAKQAEALASIPFEIIEPPTSSVPDENINALLGTQISGILYDNESPSAIVNINGQDQFVKIGDNIAGYKIDNITRNKVQISYNNNTYVASVGELFRRGDMREMSSVDNLENKFAGRYKKK